MKTERFDPGPVLLRLKDFQRRTVDTVFRRLYLDDPPARRFLVADEVGLGKTMVARGVIARALEHLHDKVERIDVVYVCSNAAIAAQNVNRLNVVGDRQFSLASRLTLLPTQVHELSKNRINFVSFTPGTTLDPVSREGIREERAVLFRMLEGEGWLERNGLLNLLQCRMGRDSWRWWAHDWDIRIDEAITQRFQKAVRSDTALRRELATMTEEFYRYRERVPWEQNNRRLAMVARLRHALAWQCLDALEPDLVILDEFQRFRDLLDGDHEAAQLAKALFGYRNARGGESARVLLLSATPYKMLALDHEQEDDHYPDFLRTLRFLFEDEAEVEAVQADIQRFRRALYALASGDEREVAAARAALEARLRRVMCRTERVGMTARRDAMLAEPPRPSPLAPEDLAQAALADRAARALGAQETIEYWKSSPYLLSFLRHYELRRKLEGVLDAPPEELLRALREGDAHMLHREQFQRYEQIHPANARLRSLLADTLETGLWRVLWLPPSLPYAAPGGPFAGLGDVTKALVFSAWNAVPDAIAALCSYEAERRALQALGKDIAHGKLHDELKPLLRFTRGGDGRFAGMPALALLVPSPTLSTLADPLAIALDSGRGAPVGRDVLLREAAALLAPRIQRIVQGARREGPPDKRWYWAAAALLDASAHPGLKSLCEGGEEAWTAEEQDATAQEDRESGFEAHLGHLLEVMAGKIEPPLGRPPEDLSEVVAELALAAPATCALRALRRIAPTLAADDPALLAAASRVAWGFRTLFNQPESIALLRGAEEESYWRLVLGHGLDGNLQAVLDEQVHVLVESLGLLDADPSEKVEKVGEALAEALSIRTAQLRVDLVHARPRKQCVEIDHLQTRCRFALRFGELRDDKDTTLARADTVRVAFNSPFRPFVLASTSIGQEGLDFHTWCHAVVHWNLPSNPVDLEQREGRVHRYKGHAVRKNLALRYGLEALREGWGRNDDPWEHLFACAADDRPDGASELWPYWVFEVEGGARVERRVPLLPFSREVEQLQRLKRSLALYRLVFGQPRQEDLLAHLAGQMSEDEAERAAAAWTISLMPKGV
jgi:hypothetical protein